MNAISQYIYLFSDTEGSSPLIKGYHACNITMYLFSDTERSNSLIKGFHECNIIIYTVILKEAVL